MEHGRRAAFSAAPEETAVVEGIAPEFEGEPFDASVHGTGEAGEIPAQLPETHADPIPVVIATEAAPLPLTYTAVRAVVVSTAGNAATSSYIVVPSVQGRVREVRRIFTHIYGYGTVDAEPVAAQARYMILQENKLATPDNIDWMCIQPHTVTPLARFGGVEACPTVPWILRPGEVLAVSIATAAINAPTNPVGVGVASRVDVTG